MKKALVLFAVFLLSILGSRSASAAPAIDVYTVGPASYLWARWGHTVICAVPEGATDGPCYDFGLSDASGFVDMVWGTFRGKPRFSVERVTVSRLREAVEVAERNLEVQRLPLSDGEATHLANALESAHRNHLRYVYSPRDANCSSLVRDMIDEATGGRLRAATTPVPTLSYRQMTEEGLSGHAPELALIALTQGTATDHIPSSFEAQIVPKGLRDGITAQFGVKPTVIIERSEPSLETSPHAGRGALIAIALGFAALAYWVERRKPRLAGHARKATGIVLATFGVVVWAFALSTVMPEFQRTWIPLLLVPTDAALGWLRPKTRLRYGSARIAVNAVLAILSFAGAVKQPLVAPALLALIPLAAVLLTERFGARLRQSPLVALARRSQPAKGASA